MYTIMSKHKKRFAYGTDFRYTKPKQRLSNEPRLFFQYCWQAEQFFRQRKMNPAYYIIVDLEIKYTIKNKYTLEEIQELIRSFKL